MVIFVNPHFTLYQAPRELPIIMPTQLLSLIKKLKAKPLTLTPRHTKLAENLLLQHRKESPYIRLPSYHYDQLKKGIIYPKCHSFLPKTDCRILVCEDCGCMEKLDSAVMQSVEEYNVLFPDRKITTSHIYEWFGGVYSKKVIMRLLVLNLKLMGFGRWAYFV